MFSSISSFTYFLSSLIVVINNNNLLSTTITFQGIEKSSEDQKSNKCLPNGIITFGFLSFLYIKNKV